jgi:hypothetical protein
LEREDADVRPDRETFDAYFGVRRGLEAGLDEAGFDGKALDLTRALLIALDEPDAKERWLRGEPVFASAPGTRAV